MPFSQLAVCFMTFLLRHMQKSNFLFPMSLGFWFFNSFSTVLFLFFLSFCCSCCYLFVNSFFCLFFFLIFLSFCRSCWSTTSSSKIPETGNSYHGVATCSKGIFCSEFTQISKHFWTYFTPNWPSHSDQGITGKLFPSQNLTVSDANFGQK